MTRFFDPVSYFTPSVEDANQPRPIDMAYHFEEDIIHRQQEDIEKGGDDWDDEQARFNIEDIEMLNVDINDLNETIDFLKNKETLTQEDISSIESRFPGLLKNTYTGLGLEHYSPYPNDIDLKASVEGTDVIKAVLMIIATIGGLATLAKWSSTAKKYVSEVGQAVQGKADLAKGIAEVTKSTSVVKKTVAENESTYKEMVEEAIKNTNPSSKGGKVPKFATIINSASKGNATPETKKELMEKIPKGSFAELASSPGTKFYAVGQTPFCRLTDLSKLLSDHAKFISKHAEAYGEFVQKVSKYFSIDFPRMVEDLNSKVGEGASVTPETDIAKVVPLPPNEFVSDFAKLTGAVVTNSTTSGPSGHIVLIDANGTNEKLKIYNTDRNSKPGAADLAHLDKYMQVMTGLKSLSLAIGKFKAEFGKNTKVIKAAAEQVSKQQKQVNSIAKSPKLTELEKYNEGLNDLLGTFGKYMGMMGNIETNLTDLYSNGSDMFSKVSGAVKTGAMEADDPDAKAEEKAEVKNDAAKAGQAVTPTNAKTRARGTELPSAQAMAPADGN